MQSEDKVLVYVMGCAGKQRREYLECSGRIIYWVENQGAPFPPFYSLYAADSSDRISLQYMTKYLDDPF